MLSMLIQFVIKLALSMCNILLIPFVTAITSLFPDVAIYIYHITTFFNYAFTFLTCILRWFLFTPGMFGLLFSYYFVKFSVWSVSATIRLGLKLYNTLKP